MKWIILTIAFLFMFASHSQTRKRYKQRNHKLQTHAYLHFDKDIELSGTLGVEYAKNWGYFELGGGLGIMPDNLRFSDFNLDDLGMSISIFFEGNFIKNKRKNDWIPGAGLKISYMPTVDVFVSPYLISKWFISYRTSLHLVLEYPMQVHQGQEWWDGLKPSFGYAYYFH